MSYVYTRESLNEIKRNRGHAGLRDVGALFQVKSTGSDTLIEKILGVQTKRADQMEVAQTTEAPDFECLYLDDLYTRPNNMESPDGRRHNPLLKSEQEGEIVVEALEKFGRRWQCSFEFVLKFQAFRLIVKKKHVDWIQLSELCRLYSLPINPVVMVLSKRLYTAPVERLWRAE